MAESGRRSPPAHAAHVALALTLATGSALAQNAPVRVVVDGRPLPVAMSLVRGGAVFLPLAPIANELGDRIEAVPAAQELRARLSHTGEVRTFIRATGEVRRDGTIVAILPGAASVTLAPRAEDQQLPLDVVALLLDVTVRMEDGGTTIAIERERPLGPGVTAHERVPFAVHRLEYSGSMTRIDAGHGQRLGIAGEAQVSESLLAGRFDVAGGSTGEELAIYGGSLALARRNQIWSAGDMELARSRIVGGPVRGLAFEQRFANAAALRAFAGGALSGVTPEVGGAGTRQFETDLASITYANGALMRNREGLGLGVGAYAFDGAGRSGLFAAGHLSFRRPHHTLLADLALGTFDTDLPGAGVPDEDLDGFAPGLEALDSFDLGRHSITLQLSHYGDKFASPQVGAGLRGRTSLAAGWSAPIAPGFTAGVSVGRSLVRVPYEQASTTMTASSSYAASARYLPDAALYYTMLLRDESATQNVSQLDLGKQLGDWRPFLTYSRFAEGSIDTGSATLGTTAWLRRAGGLRAALTTGRGAPDVAALDWTAPAFLRGRLLLTTGLEYLRGGGAGGGNTVSARAAVELQLPGGHAVRAGYYDRGTGYELIISLGGPLIAPRPRMHATGSTTSVLVFPGRIAGRLYRDVDRDGRYDEGSDTPLAGARLLLDGATVTVTNADGVYRYDHVPPGAHSIGVDLTSVSAVLSPAGELRRSLHVAAKVDYVADFAFVQTGGIGGLVFLDEDADGRRDEDEPPVPDVRVICSCGTDTLTTVDGTFVIGDLLPGTVFLSLDLHGLPASHRPEPERVPVEVIAGRQSYGLEIAVQRVPRPVMERPAARR